MSIQESNSFGIWCRLLVASMNATERSSGAGQQRQSWQGIHKGYGTVSHVMELNELGNLGSAGQVL